MSVLDDFPETNPSYLTIAGDCLYAALETGELDGKYGGGVASYKIEKNGALVPVSRRYTHGTAPCHLHVSPDGKKLFVANYGDGKLSVFPCAGGVLGEAEVIAHSGSGPDKSRQERPHVHCAQPVPGANQMCVMDLGIDSALFYNADTLRVEGVFHARPGSGPRHVAFSADGRYAWMVCELSSEVLAVKPYGAYEQVCVVSALPPGYDGKSASSAIKLSKDGRYLFVTNRGHDSIASFSIDAGTGVVTPLAFQAAGGRTPRDIAISPDGGFLYAANQDSDSVTAFRVNNGGLEPLGQITIPAPVCIAFMEE
jgi:6-phosphogluconolactonase